MFFYAQNLLTNGNFETWTSTASSMPNSWDKGAGAVNTNYFYATDPGQGNVLQLVDALNQSLARRFHTTANFSVADEGTYRVTFKVKGNVGLRAVILVKGTASPNTNTQSATNHYTLITEYPSGTIVSDWTTLQYDIVVPETATFGDDYKLHFSWSSSDASKPSCDFYIDDISLVKYVEVEESSDRLKNIVITPLNYTVGTGTADLTIPGFDEDIFDYTFTSSYREVPVISAEAVDPTATVEIVQATSLTGSQAERTATITVTTTDLDEKTYTVELVKHPGFISGISWDLRSDNYVEWESAIGLYTRTENQSAGNIYAFGNTSARCISTSAPGYRLTTPILENGASSLSFYLKNTDIAGDDTEVVVKKSTTASPDWSEIGRVQPNTGDYSNVWKEVIMNINDNASGLKIRFEFAKTITTAGKVFLDDVTIQPYSPLSSIIPAETIQSVVFGYNGRIHFNTSENIPFIIYNLNGSKISEGYTKQQNSIELSKGIYFVTTQGKTAKIIL
ncbi:hypothetical protein MASR2M117_15660 [Paludibacter sp.]